MLSFEVRIAREETISIDWWPTKSRKPSLLCCLTHSWWGKIDISMDSLWVILFCVMNLSSNSHSARVRFFSIGFFYIFLILCANEEKVCRINVEFSSR